MAGFHTFRRLGKSGLVEGIILYQGHPVPPARSPEDPPQGPRGFTIEIGVVPETSRFGFSMPGESGNWREFGLRERLGVILHGDVYEGSSFERDFFFYGDQRSLEEQLARTLSLALERGPLVWLQMAERLMSAEPDSGED